ncbi:uncharacterized protein MKK02DRAFT_38234 [Dioszegia hungarica]|uniref:BZIP domain-containing protein n=1 Tax=Dioszegia hungarica TaxID=4972 RepID=A0AA38H498_9TREE|nr:uncharacterized protein MKK02DRAFT_38234 [Dioszegia hungarica]KAI9633577.1 hypothetical protein MKK02DRAFT_38234 [Dioszegia hungarica]
MPPPPPPLQHLAGYSEPMSFASSSSSAASSQHNLHTQLAAYTSTPLASPAQEAWDYMSRWGGGGHANQAEAEPSGRRHTLSHAQSAQPGGQVSQTVSPAATPLSNPASGEDSEDKRVRNTVASAKFRAKKKAQVANVQRTITDLESQQASLEADVASLKRENGLLREMVQLKFGTKISDN